MCDSLKKKSVEIVNLVDDEDDDDTPVKQHSSKKKCVEDVRLTGEPQSLESKVPEEGEPKDDAEDQSVASGPLSLTEIARANKPRKEHQFEHRRPNANSRENVLLSFFVHGMFHVACFALRDLPWTCDEWEQLQKQEKYHELCADWLVWVSHFYISRFLGAEKGGSFKLKRNLQPHYFWFGDGWFV